MSSFLDLTSQFMLAFTPDKSNLEVTHVRARDEHLQTKKINKAQRLFFPTVTHLFLYLIHHLNILYAQGLR